jgi:hypothetical protein
MPERFADRPPVPVPTDDRRLIDAMLNGA